MINLKDYFAQLTQSVECQFALANAARATGVDKEHVVETQLARDLSERVVGLLSVVAPMLKGKGVETRIKELEVQYGKLDWRVACVIALEIAQEKFCSFSSRQEAIEVGIRTGFAYVTVGVVSAPLEGLTRIDIRKRADGKEYIALMYAGPVRNAGGTAASVSVIIADYVRTHLGMAAYDPTSDEIERSCTEVQDYHERITNLQYHPARSEVATMFSRCPVQIDGEPTERMDVSNYKDLSRIATNRIRGGFCLVLAECLCLKAPKLWKQLARWGDEMGIGHWSFLEEFLRLQSQEKSGMKTDGATSQQVTPVLTYIKDTVGGRPIFAHPMRHGAFRLRYGKSRTNGFSAQSIHPATMVLLDGFIAIGTQLKTERPGKSTVFTSCDTIEPPIVRLSDGSVVKVRDVPHARSIASQVVEILFLGDVLINYGDFLDRAHMLVPVGYCEEWWRQETGEREPTSFAGALALVQTKGIPMHPRYIHYWKGLDISHIHYFHTNYGTKMKATSRLKHILDHAGVPYSLEDGHISLADNERMILESIFATGKTSQATEALTYINEIAGYEIRDKCGTFIGARMGRPEKAKMRKLKTSPHGLFAMGQNTSIKSALERRDTILNTGEKMNNIFVAFKEAMEHMGLTEFPENLKGVSAPANPEGYSEYIGKGILRAMRDLQVNKDGTIRYDASEVPITHFKPCEVGAPVERLRDLGYSNDIDGKPLTRDDQILEMLPQDIILPSCPDSPDPRADDILLDATRFIDDELVKIYHQKAFYQAKNKEDLIGQLVVGLAPHTSAGIVGRIIGFSKTQGLFCHPYFHAAMRRDCDGDESSVILLMDALLNFSRHYLTNRRGSTMDAPLVLTATIEPSEVDDMVFNLERVAGDYPLALYEGAQACKMPWEVEMPTIGDALGHEAQWHTGFTHDTADMNAGVLCSRYKLIPSMEEKVWAQMALADKIKAVDAADVARIVIQTHFLRDTKGNLRKFLTQQFRNPSTGERFRRPPLKGGDIIFTVSPASVLKYLGLSKQLVEKYAVPAYLRETIELLEKQCDQTFGRKRDAQQQLIEH